MRPNPEPWMLRALLLAALSLCGASAVQAAGGVFKLVDGNGVVRYDDYSLLAERLSRASLARGLVAADARATVPTEFVAEVAEQCRDLRERSESYASAREIYGRDPAGNQYRFSANQVALEVARLQQQTRRYCRPLAAQYLLQEARLALRSEQVQK